MENDQSSEISGILARLRSLLHRRPLLLVGAAYFFSTFLVGPLDPGTASSEWQWELGNLYVGRPAVTSGDSPHYLVLVNSLIEDGDFNVRNNYDQAAAGGWDQGTRYRGVELDRHVDDDSRGQQLLTHPPFMPMVMALFSWPFRGTEWVEPVCIWLTVGVTFLIFPMLLRIRPGASNWILLLAFCTPLWCYGRDVWTEPWLTTVWVALLAFPHPLAQALLSISGILIKHSFAVVPAALALYWAWRGRWRRSLLLGGSTALALGVEIAFIQYLFRDVGHFNLFHSGLHQFRGESLVTAPFGLTWKAVPGLLLSPTNGFLFFAPFLAWGLWNLRRGGSYYFPLIVFFAMHGMFLGWRAGTGFSARYLVPLLPVLVFSVLQTADRHEKWSFSFRLAVFYSAFFCTIAGLLPAAAFENNPLEIILVLVQGISEVLASS